MKILRFFILFILIGNVSAITIDNPNFIINSSSFNTTFSSNQTYNSITPGTNYLNLSYNSTEYINFTTPITSGTQLRIPYTIIGSYLQPSGIAVVNNVNRTMTYTSTYLYFDTSELWIGNYNTSKFYVTDLIGQKIITITSNLTTSPTNTISFSGGGAGGWIPNIPKYYTLPNTTNITNFTKTIIPSLIRLQESIPKLDKKSLVIYSVIIIIALIVIYYTKNTSSPKKQYHFTKKRP